MGRHGKRRFGAQVEWLESRGLLSALAIAAGVPLPLPQGAGTPGVAASVSLVNAEIKNKANVPLAAMPASGCFESAGSVLIKDRINLPLTAMPAGGRMENAASVLIKDKINLPLSCWK
jgi:hypothetical protein